MKKMFQSQVVGRVRKTFVVSVFAISSLVGFTLWAQEISANLEQKNVQSYIAPASGYEATTVSAKPLNLPEVIGQIEYPKECSNTGAQGKVYVRILVDTEGKPISYVVLKSENEALTNAAVKVIYNLVFTPGQLEGKVVNSWVTIPFNFKVIGNTSKALAYSMPN